ncbi:DNA-binding protein [Paenibacillaceae bacterium]|nr:DNA-binding protein [Paenibacillaceae bacterium]
MMMEYLKEWTYLAVFILAALPWLESAVVVTIGILLGLNPIAVTVAAFLGNWLVLLLVIFAFDRFQQWRKKRSKKESDKEGKIKKRAHHIFVKYGLPGLAILGPLLIGTEIAAAFAMVFKAPRGPVTFWLTTGMAFWTIVFAVAAYYGFDAIGIIRTDLFTGG